MVNVNRDNRRFSRVTIEHGLRVEMSSIGSDIKYIMETKNISDTGFFLDFERPGRFPFTPASIMEVWLELEEDNKVFFNGKMTRVVYPDETARPGVAIRIVQIDSNAESALREFIKKTVLSNEQRLKNSVDAGKVKDVGKEEVSTETGKVQKKATSKKKRTSKKKKKSNTTSAA